MPATGEVHEIDLEEGRARRIGRLDDADLVLDHPSVGRLVVEIRIEHGRATITDLGSGGGSAVNGVLRPYRLALNDGDELHIGALLFRVGLDGAGE